MSRDSGSSLAAGEGERTFHEAKLATARYCAAHALTDTAGRRRKVECGHETLVAVPRDALGAHRAASPSDTAVCERRFVAALLAVKREIGLEVP